MTAKLKIVEEVVQNGGIWVVRYNFHDLEAHRLHTDRTPEEIALDILEYTLNTGGGGFTVFPTYVEDGADPHGYGNEYVETPRLREVLTKRLKRLKTNSAYVTGIQNTDGDGNTLRLGFGRNIEEFPDSLSTVRAPRGIILIDYVFFAPLSGVEQKSEYRNPTPEEVAFLNRLSAHSPDNRILDAESGN